MHMIFYDNMLYLGDTHVMLRHGEFGSVESEGRRAKHVMFYNEKPVYAQEI